jgi:ABC-type polysaccharide transport system permease subunit
MRAKADVLKVENPAAKDFQDHPENALHHNIGFWRARWNVKALYLMLLIPVAYVFIFNYTPLYGVLMAFKRFQPRLGVWGSPWVGLYNFQRFFGSPNFFIILRNTLVLSVYQLVIGFPFPILIAIFVNHSMMPKFKKAVQSITFAPYFFSAVVLVGLVSQVLAMRTGGVNLLLSGLGLRQFDFMGSVSWFPHIFVWSGIWQSAGYSAIIYISSLSSVDPTLHEAAIIDGATIWQRVWNVDLATIRPIIIIMLILSMGSILGLGFEKAYLMQNSLNLDASEIIATYVYKVGIGGSGGGVRADYSFGTAIGLFQNVVGCILTLSVNRIAHMISGESLF